MNFMERYVCAWTSESIRHIATPSLTAKATYFYIQEIGSFETLSNYFAERSHINSYLLVYTLSGSGRLTYADKTYLIPKGHLFLIDCMEHHYYETTERKLHSTDFSTTDEPWTFLWFHFNGATTPGYYELFAQNGPPVLLLPSDSNIPIKIEEMLNLHKNKDLTAEILCSQKIIEILTQLALIRTDHLSSDNVVPQYIHEMVQIMDKQFNEPFTLDHFADRFNLSKFHLAKSFKKYTGFSPNEYLINARISYAKELLLFSDHSISEISEIIGTSNVTHFINLFKSREGSTPYQFKLQRQRG